MIIKKINVDSVNVAKYNPRKDLQPGDPEYERLKRSVERWDLVEPLVWNKRSGNLVGGHQRLKILTARGDSDVDVSVVDLEDQDEAALNIALNKIGGEWDMPKLADLLSELDGHGFDATFTGFDGDELENLLTWTPGTVIEDEVPEVPAKAKSKLGEVYELGRHRVMCGDSTAREAVSALLGGETPGCIITDPPYGISLDTDFSSIKGSLASLGRQRGTQGRKYDAVTGDNKPFDSSLVRGHISADEEFWFGADYYAQSLGNTEHTGSWLVWDKRKDEAQDRAIGSGFELIWSRQKHKRLMLRHQWFGFLSGENSKDARERVHPTQKPIALIADILTRWHKDGPVADPFLGSGTTLIAAEQLGRTCYGMEIEPKYVDVIRQRYANFVKDPQFSPTGKLTKGKTYAGSSS